MARHLIQNAATGATRIVGDAALPFFPGFAIVDTYDDGIPPVVFYGAGEADLRYVNVTELSDPTSAASVALRAAFAPRVPAPDRVALPGLGVELGARASECTTSVTPVNQRPTWVVFQPSRPVTINGLTWASDSTAAAATPTTVQYSLYAVTEDNYLFPMARSANDPTIFAAGMTKYPRAFGSGWAPSVTLLPGRSYAAGVLIDSAAALPALPSNAGVRTVLQDQTRSRRSGAATTLPGAIIDVFAALTGGAVPWCRGDAGGTPNLARSAVLLGDSFLASSAYAAWFGFGNAQGGARLHPVNTAGVGGETIAQVFTRWAADVTAYDPEWVVLHAGTNDIVAEGASAATVISRYQQVIAQAAAERRSLLICTPPSNTASDSGRKTVLGAVRAWLLTLNQPNVVVADTGLALSTGDGVTADATKLADTVHPNPAGNQAMADVLDGVIATVS